jgi:hypothetical protein
LPATGTFNGRFDADNPSGNRSKKWLITSGSGTSYSADHSIKLPKISSGSPPVYTCTNPVSISITVQAPSGKTISGVFAYAVFGRDHNATNASDYGSPFACQNSSGSVPETVYVGPGSTVNTSNVQAQLTLGAPTLLSNSAASDNYAFIVGMSVTLSDGTQYFAGHDPEMEIGM